MSSALSIPVNVGGVPTPPTAAATPLAAQPVATDFMLLVQQLLGQTQAPPVGSMPVASETLQQAVASEDELEEGKVNECAGLAALLALLPQASAGAPVAKMPAEASAAPGSVIDSVMQRAPTGSPMPMDVIGEGAAERLLSELTSSESMPEIVDSEIASFAPAAPEASSTAHRAALGETALTRAVQAPVGSNAWSDEIATRLTLMAEQGKQAASLRLSPEHLGPLEVRITVSDDQASVWFGAAHADTRAAIEQALPRLRELFEAQGMSLADAGVFREPPRDQPHSQASSPTLADDAAAAEESVTIARARLGLIDAYA